MTRSQPDHPRGERAPLKGCAFTEAEARELAELIFFGIEFDKPDVIQELEYDLILASPALSSSHSRAHQSDAPTPCLRRPFLRGRPFALAHR